MTPAWHVARNTTLPVLFALTFALGACGSEDVGGDQSGTDATSGVSSRAAGGRAGIDTAGGTVIPGAVGSPAAPGSAPGSVPASTPGTAPVSGQPPGASGAAAADTAAKTRGARP